ncbi:Gustatory receptor 53 [Halyomorpha halys]|nr:Gustatory receptor 53 [Halyomorpha halys]
MMFRPITQAIESDIIFTASSLFGIFPFRIIEKKLNLDKLMLLYSLVISSLMTLVYFYFMGLDIYNKMISSKNLLLSITLSSFTFQAMSNFLFAFHLYFHRNAVVEIVYSLDALVPFFRKLKPNKKYILLESFLVPMVCCSGIYFGDNSSGNTILPLVYSLMLIGRALGCGQFLRFVDVVNHFFQSSTKCLERIKHPVSILKLTSLEKLVKAGTQLVSTSDKINAVYSQLLLFSIFTYYCSFMLHVFFIYHTASNERWNHPKIPADIVMSIYNLFMIWRLAHGAVHANYMSKEFNNLLYQLMIEDKENKIVDNDKLMLDIAMKREVVFTACGFFILDYTLLHSVIASATTYLVILIQFDYTGNGGQRAVANLTTPIPLFTAT